MFQQVQCIVHYYFLLRCAAHVTHSFDANYFRQIPHVAAKSDSLNISKLREHLQDQGHLRQARAILDTEVGFLTSQGAKHEACRSLLRACATSESIEPIWLIEGRTRLQLAQNLSQEHQVQDANREFGLACTLLQQAPVLASQNNSALFVELAKLRSTQQTDESLILKDWVQFIEHASSTEDYYIISTALTAAADNALEVFRKTPSDINRKIFWQWQPLAESMLEEVGDIYFLYIGRIATANTALFFAKNYGAILKWFQDFDVKYPNFNLWAIKIAGKRAEKQIYTDVGDKLNFDKTIEEMETLTMQMDAFWSDEGYNPPHRPDQQQSRMLSKLTFGSELTQEQNKTLDYVWYSQWSEPMVDTFLATEQILLQWLKQDAAKGKLTQVQLETILTFEKKPQEEVDVYHLLSQLTPERLSSHLYGNSSSPVSATSWASIFSTLYDWLIDNADYDEVKRHHLIVKLQENKVCKSWSSAVDRVTECENVIALGSRFNAKAKRTITFDLGHWLGRLASLKVIKYNEIHGHEILNEEIPEFGEILGNYSTALEYYRQQGQLHPQAVIWRGIALLYFHAAKILRPAALLAFLESLDSANDIYERMLEGWKYLRGWDKVEKLLIASQEQMRLQIFPLSIHIYCQFQASHHQVRNELIWNQIQVAKSIGLGWLMRTNGLEQPEGISIESLEHSPDFEALPTITVEEMQTITNDAGSDALYVDWYNGSSPGRNTSELLIATTSQGKTPRVLAIGMTWDKVNAILDKFLLLGVDDLCRIDAKKLLHKLNPLVAPLATLSKPGQVLVFSAVGRLHRVPLHALLVGGEVLIRRNPVVYSSSMTVLNVVFQNRKAYEQKSLDPYKAAIFGHPPSEQGLKTLASTAMKFSVKPYIHDSFTVLRFETALRDPSLNLIHYHGHVTFEENAPTDHGLELQDRRFTLRDVIDLAPLPSLSCHATLLGCGSGMSKTSVSNDVVGLVPAFLYAGAASTVSTLWRFDDEDASLYSTFFYEEFERPMAAIQGGRVDLARANQKAILKIMELKPELYHWAPFVLNGYWMMHVSGGKRP